MYRKVIPALLIAVLAGAPAGAQTARRHTTTRPAVARAATGVSAGAWRNVYNDSDVAVSVDTVATKRLADGTFRTRLRWQYSGDKQIGRKQTYRTMVERKLVNCATLGVKPVSAQTYDAAGRPVSSFNTSDRDVKAMDWAKRPAGSSAAKAYAAVCSSMTK